MFRKQELIQKKTQMSVYEKKTIHDIFLISMEWLEKYIELTYRKEFPDWERRKQIRDNLSIERMDIYENPKRAETTLSSQLHLLADTLEDDATDEFREELKQEFYKWISATGIDANNCPERLKHFIFGLNEIFEGNYEKIRHDIVNRKKEIEIDSPEYLERMQRMFSDSLNSTRKEIKTEKSLEGERDWEIRSSFGGGSMKQGEQAFGRITKNVADSHQNFHFKDQRGYQTSSGLRTNSEIVQDVKQNPRNWRIDEMITSYDNLGREKKEIVLIHYSARIDYDLNSSSGSIYKAERFSRNEIAEIESALSISLSSTSAHQTRTYSKDNRPSGGKGGGFGGYGSSVIFGSFTVISLIGLAFTKK